MAYQDSLATVRKLNHSWDTKMNELEAKAPTLQYVSFKLII